MKINKNIDMNIKGKKTSMPSGITLIALVITIIVLLILAGVALASLSGENGLLKRSSQAKEEAIKAQLKEEIEMAIMDIQTEELSKGNGVTLKSLAGENEGSGQLESNKDLQEGNITADLGEEEITGEYKGYNYKIDENLNVTIEDKIQGIIFNYTLSNNGKYTNRDIILTIKASSTNGKITEIQSPEGIEKNGDETYTIKANGEYEFTVKDETGATRTRIININKIDKIEPIEVTVTINEETITTKGFTITVEAKDNENGSGIGRYEYYIKQTSGDEYTKYDSTSNKYNIDSLEPGTECEVYVIAYDKANNPKESTHISCQIKDYILEYPILTLNGMMNCIDENGNYYLDKNIEAKASDALKVAAYDGEYSTYHEINHSYPFFEIAPECWGKYIAVYCQQPQNTGYGCFREMKERKKEPYIISGYLYKLSGQSGANLQTKCVTIYNEAKWGMLFTGTGSGTLFDVHEVWCTDENLNGTVY